MKITIAILLCLMLCGCAMIKHTDKDGNVTEYWRLLEQSIGAGSIELPCGGKLTFEGQEAKLPPVKILIPGGIIIETGKVKP